LKSISKGKLIFIAAIVAAIFCVWHFNLTQYLSFEYMQEKKQAFADFYSENSVLTIGGYLIVYIAVTALSIPGATILTLMGGFLFGVVKGTIIVSFASTIGATCAFLAARFLLKDSIQQKFGDKLKTINDGVAKEGGFYLFTMRLIPAFPFFVINLVMGLTPINVRTFFLVSQAGMLPGTIVYVNAGTQLSKIESLKGILSLELILSFAALGILPILIKKIMGWIRPGNKTATNTGDAQ
tara:strand:+ start:92968 stop:93684 length:717 start_codon:yes stop_codon:yes gene_type:complete